MSGNHGRSVDRRSVEQVLRGDHAAGGPALHAVLAAAAAPARDGELDGEQAAMAAFRAARPLPDPRPRRRVMIKLTLAKLLTTKAAVAAAATAAVAVGGVATVATTTGLSHGGGSTGATHASNSASATPTGDTGTSGAARDSGTAARDSGTAEHHEPGATPAPSLVGLCHAYTAGAGSEHGKALQNPAFTVLITTAGGKDNVDAYCTTLLAGDRNPGTSNNNNSNNGHDTSATATAVPGNDRNGQTHATQNPADHATDTTHPSH